MAGTVHDPVIASMWQPPAEPGFFLHQVHGHTLAGQVQRRRHPGSTCSQYDDIYLAHGRQLMTERQNTQPFILARCIEKNSKLACLHIHRR